MVHKLSDELFRDVGRRDPSKEKKLNLQNGKDQILNIKYKIAQFPQR